jgi:hypothetical protein
MVIEVHDVIVAFATPEEVYLLEENILAQHWSMSSRPSLAKLSAVAGISHPPLKKI